MQADLFHKSHRRHVKELNIVPILDMMTTVIFFLLLSTSFIEFTKITVPPSSTATITDPITPPPVTPRMILMKKDLGYRLQLTWTGRSPGVLFRTLENEKIEAAIKQAEELKQATDPKGIVVPEELVSKEIMRMASEMIKEFKVNFPSENTFQVGLGGKVAYQNLVGVMDGIQIGVGALKWTDEGKLVSSKNEKTPEAVIPAANIVLVSYAEVDAETSKSGEEL
jgi:biopolymer transport protein ExbD